MRALLVAVGKRTEHWEGFFEALARRPGLELFLQTADISPLAAQQLTLLAQLPNVRFHTKPYWIGEDRTGHMASIAFAPGSWRDLCEAPPPDVIHVIGEAAYLATYQTIHARNRLWPGVPITLYAAQNVVTRFPQPFTSIERYAYRNIALALPITPAALAVLRAKGYHGDAQIVPLGVDTTRFRPRKTVPPGPFTLGFVGRLERHKGVADLLEAAERAACRLLVVGDGSLRPLVEAAAGRRPGDVEYFRWASHEHLPRLLHRMHALALPSVEILQRGIVPWRGIPLREQFGRVLVEAMASGVPVIGSTVGEIAYVLGSAGLVVPPGAPDRLAEAVARLRADPGLAGSLSRAGAQRASTFRWDRIAARVVALWERLASSGRAPGPSGFEGPGSKRTDQMMDLSSHEPALAGSLSQRRDTHGRTT